MKNHIEHMRLRDNAFNDGCDPLPRLGEKGWMIVGSWNGDIMLQRRVQVDDRLDADVLGGDFIWYRKGEFDAD